MKELQAVDDRLGRGAVGVADAEVDHVAAGGDRRLFLLVDFGEQVGGEVAEAFGLHKRHGGRPAGVRNQGDKGSVRRARSGRERFLRDIFI